jgi:hypothetical protein
MQSHEQAVMRIGQYLLSSKDKGMIYSPDLTKELKSMLMQTLREDGIQHNLMMPTISTCTLVFSSITLAVPSIGRLNCRQKLLYQLQQLNTLPCQRF